MFNFNVDSENIQFGDIKLVYLKKILPKDEEIGLCLISGGLDSLVVSNIAKRNHTWTIGIFIDYGQRGRKHEEQIGINLSKKLGLDGFFIIKNSLLRTITELTGIPLMDSKKNLPKISFEDLSNLERLRQTVRAIYVPFRQVNFYITTATLCEAIFKSTNVKTASIYAGGNATDAETFPDETKDFFHACEDVLRLGGFYGSIKLDLPLLTYTKENVVKKCAETGLTPLVPFSCSCYSPIKIIDEKPLHCGTCEACIKRKVAFQKQNIKDHTLYRE